MAWKYPRIVASKSFYYSSGPTMIVLATGPGKSDDYFTGELIWYEDQIHPDGKLRAGRREVTDGWRKKDFKFIGNIKIQKYDPMRSYSMLESKTKRKISDELIRNGILKLEIEGSKYHVI